MMTTTGTESATVTVSVDMRDARADELRTLLRDLEWRPEREGDSNDWDAGHCHFCNGHKDATTTILPDDPRRYELVAGQHDTWCQWHRLSALITAVFGDMAAPPGGSAEPSS